MLFRSARLGFGPGVGVDADPVAVAAARSNVASNSVRVEVLLADVLCVALPAADLLVANIDLPVVEALLARHPADRAITSGYLDHEAPRVQFWGSSRDRNPRERISGLRQLSELLLS